MHLGSKHRVSEFRGQKDSEVKQEGKVREQPGKVEIQERLLSWKVSEG